MQHRTYNSNRNLLPPALLLGLLLSGACSSLPFLDAPESWNPADFSVGTAWSAKEAQVPIALANLPNKFPKKFKLPHLVQPGDQAGLASGTAWAAGYLATSHLYRYKYKEMDYTCSSSFIYNQLVNGRDTGIEIIEALQFLKNTGCAHVRYMPYAGLSLLQRPNARAIQDASRHLIKGFARIEFTDIEQVKAHLLQGSVIIVTMIISENFVNLKEDLWEAPAGRQAGRQTLGVVGYDDSKGTFLLQNSAGSLWGKQGQTNIPYTWFIRLTQKAYILW